MSKLDGHIFCHQLSVFLIIKGDWALPEKLAQFFKIKFDLFEKIIVDE